jgi:two-component system chemotaxis response regulator CheY
LAGEGRVARILVVDDEPLVRDTLRLLLESAGHEVIQAEDGDGALALYPVERPDLVISDMVMPARSGLETIEELRRMNPAVRIIAISGGGRGGGLDQLEAAQQRGAAAVLAKPFRRAALLELVGRVLGDG